MIDRPSVRIVPSVVLGSLVLFAGCDSGNSSVCDDDPCACGPCIPIQPPREVDLEPAWSPDGRTIAYTHVAEEPFDERGFYQIWLLDAETLQRRFLTSAGAAGGLPAWSPDGTRIAYVVGGDIHTVEVGTGVIERLTECGGCFYPNWSPDGTLIAYDAVFRGDSSGVWTMKPDGTRKRQLLQSGRAPDWSPDGATLVISKAYFIGSRRLVDIAIADTATSEVVRLTYDEREDRSPAWSPDGRRIAWATNAEGLANPASGIWLMDADGSNQRQLTRREGASFTLAFSPNWSSDGSRLVYVGYNTDTDTYTLWTVNADGSEDRPLTRPEDYPFPKSAGGTTLNGP